MTPWQRYFLVGRQAGCSRDQMLRFEQADVILQERQLLASAAARLCDLPDGPTAIGYGGARGGGKSHWLLAQMGVDDCQRVPGLKCLLLRKVGKANLEHFEDLRRKLFFKLPHEFSAFRGILTFANGSRIIAGHFQNEKDIDAYLGLEYDVIGVEEATTLTARKYQDISTCCRSSKPNWRPRIYSTTNPGGIGHVWYKKKFIEPYLDQQRHLSVSPAVPQGNTGSGSSDSRTQSGHQNLSALPAGEGQAEGPASPQPAPGLRGNPHPAGGHPRHSQGTPHPDFVHLLPIRCGEGISAGRGASPAPAGEGQAKRPYEDTLFIPARVDDNAFNNPEYRKVLEGLSGLQRKAWLEGSWDIAAGQFFSNFRRELHVLDEFDTTRAVEWWAAMDYGYAHYTVALLACRDGDGNTFVVDEHAARMWLPQRHAEAIKAMLGRHAVRGVFGLREREAAARGGGAAKGGWLIQDFGQTRPLELGDLRRFVAGADVFSRQSDGTTIAGQYARYGIKLRCANTDRVNGWAEVMQGLGEVAAPLANDSNGDRQTGEIVRPTLFFHKRCARLIETLPALLHDPNRPEDVLKVDADEDGAGGDDAADCLRYLVATKPRGIVVRRLSGW